MSALDAVQEKRAIALKYAEAEVIQARLERDRLGADIGSQPPIAQQENYMAALAKLRALETEQ